MAINVMSLERTAIIVRQEMLSRTFKDTGTFPQTCQKESLLQTADIGNHYPCRTNVVEMVEYMG